MKGFTLIETMVILSILSLLTALTMVAWPRIRDRQALVLAEHQIEDLVRQAQDRAVHEVRPEACLVLFDSDSPDRRRCSDVGLALRGTQIRLFADTEGDANRYDDGDDFLITTHELPAGTSTDDTAWQSFVFKATPPRITLYNQIGNIVTTTSDTTLVLKIGNTEQIIHFLPYGQLTTEENE